jgi:broad specificity phosphatase PhoE
MVQKIRRVLLVQNGESSRGHGDRFCGFTDPPLSEKGRQDVLDFLNRLGKDRLPRCWFSSDRRRAQETFDILSAGLHAPIIRLTDTLREMNFGDFENLTWEELPPAFQRHYESCLKDPRDLKFPRGESFLDLCRRVSSGALEILAYDDNSDIGIVGHQGSIKIWSMMANALAPAHFFEAIPEFSQGIWLNISLGDVASWRRAHL